MSTSTIVAGVLWLVALWRLPSIRHSHKQRSLALTLVTLAVAMTFEVPPVKEAVDAAVGADARLSPLLKHLLGVTSAAYLLDFVIAVVRPQGLARRTRLVAAGVTLPLMLAFYALANWTPGGPVRLGGGRAALFPVLYMAVFTLYIGIAMVVATWLFLSGVRHSRTLLGKAGLGFLGLGTLLGSLYAIQRIVFVTVQLASGANYPDLENLLSTALKQATVLSVALGVCLPPLSVAVEYVAAWSTLRKLRPLWVQLTEAAPYVVLATSVARRRIPFRLERCVIEIEDACLALREYVSVDVYAEARKFVRQEGVDAQYSDAVAEACWLRTAAQCARSGVRLQGVEYPPLGVTGRDRASELSWLRTVASAYLSSPVVSAFARQEKSSVFRGQGDAERISSHDN
ncbi:MAB_1171c family putative transporter [uncultured Streptomyces sp.]|uniref:MAB_1171c family putative transporter n=1 Tax=uncultured Streptomyces sp. TaxID=174707 RepID=UPI00260CE47A|nr:MAB_1171c family putative transporter [uncultured Streptomyces sp.]